MIKYLHVLIFCGLLLVGASRAGKNTRKHDTVPLPAKPHPRIMKPAPDTVRKNTTWSSTCTISSHTVSGSVLIYEILPITNIRSGCELGLGDVLKGHSGTFTCSGQNTITLVYTEKSELPVSGYADAISIEPEVRLEEAGLFNTYFTIFGVSLSFEKLIILSFIATIPFCLIVAYYLNRSQRLRLWLDDIRYYRGLIRKREQTENEEEISRLEDEFIDRAPVPVMEKYMRENPADRDMNNRLRTEIIERMIKLGNFSEALSRLERMLGIDDPLREYAFFARGYSSMLDMKYSKAIDFFKAYLANFPDGEYRDSALEHIIHCDTEIKKQDLYEYVCPDCGADCTFDDEKCQHCGIGLYEENKPLRLYRGFKEVATLNSEEEASLVQGLLNVHGFESIMQSDIVHSVHPVSIGRIGSVRVLVNEEEYTAAKEVVDGAGSSDGQPEA